MDIFKQGIIYCRFKADVYSKPMIVPDWLILFTNLFGAVKYISIITDEFAVTQQFCILLIIFYSLDLLRHRVMRGPQRRKRKAADPTPHLTKKRGERKRNWKATRRKVKRTKGNMGKITKRNKGRGNTNRRPPPLLPAPVNPRIVTETTWQCSV